MQSRHALSPSKVANFVDEPVPESFDHTSWPRKDSIPVTLEYDFTSPYTTQPSHTHHAPEAIHASSSSQPSEMVGEKSSPQPDQTKVKIACLRCRGKKSRCSGQRPCGGCTNDGLDCMWDDDEAKSKRASRTARLSEGKRKVAKGRYPLQVRSACTRCQHRKAKCTGTRPACAYCVERQLDCTYDVAEGETRTNDLKRRLRDSEIKAQAFGRILAVMREGNIWQATELLARLRLGETPREVLQSLPREVLQSLPSSIACPSPNDGSMQSELDRRPSTL